MLGLPGATPAERREAARAHVPEALLELFEARLPALASELAAGRAGLGEGVSLYHMVLEGIVFDAGQRALLDDLGDGALPGVREGIERVELDERWHWGDAVPAATRERAAYKCARRLSVSGLLEHAGGRVAGSSTAPVEADQSFGSVRGSPKRRKTPGSANQVIAATASPSSVRTISP